METSKSIEERLSNIESRLLSKKAVLNLDELAEYTGLSKSCIYKLTSASDIPHYKPNGKYIFFSRVEIEAYLLRNRVKTNEEIDAEASTYVTIGNQNKM